MRVLCARCAEIAFCCSIRPTDGLRSSWSRTPLERQRQRLTGGTSWRISAHADGAGGA